jgi:phosphate transport system protein
MPYFEMPYPGDPAMKYLEQEMERLQRGVLGMAGTVEEAIRLAVEALHNRDATLAHQVVDGDDRIDGEENQIDEECLKILALHQPVASDLRRVTAVMHISTDLERMADLAEAMAERAVALAGLPTMVPLPQLQTMADLTLSMVRQALDAFINLDGRSARVVCGLDDQVDRLNAAAIAELVAAMKADSAVVEAGLSLFSAVRHLEGIADLAASIAEDVIYLVEGEIVRHRSCSSEKR